MLTSAHAGEGFEYQRVDCDEDWRVACHSNSHKPNSVGFLKCDRLCIGLTYRPMVATNLEANSKARQPTPITAGN